MTYHIKYIILFSEYFETTFGVGLLECNNQKARCSDMIVLNNDTKITYKSSGLFKSEGVWIHPSRVIDTYEIIFVCEGKVCISEEDTEYELHKNDILVLEPGKRHCGYRETGEHVSFFWIHFDMDMPNRSSLPKHITLPEPYILKNLFSQCLHTVNTPTHSDACGDLYTALITEEISSLDKTETLKTNRLCADIKEWIRINIDKNITVSDVAENFGYHENHVSRVFKRAYGSGLKEYIVKMRLENAKNLLSASLYTVKQISAILSFGTENNFVKFFKYHMKITPTEYRNSYVNTHINKA